MFIKNMMRVIFCVLFMSTISIAEEGAFRVGLEGGLSPVDLEAEETAQELANLSGSTVTAEYDTGALVLRLFADYGITSNLKGEVGIFQTSSVDATYTIGGNSATESYDASGLDISGKYYDQTLSKNEKDLRAVNNSKITFGLNKLLIDGKEFTLPFGNYDNLKIHGSQETHFYSIYDKDSKQIYLYDNQKIVNGFPIFSNSDIDFNSDNNKIDIVFLGDYNEIQLYSIK